MSMGICMPEHILRIVSDTFQDSDWFSKIPFVIRELAINPASHETAVVIVAEVGIMKS